MYAASLIVQGNEVRLEVNYVLNVLKYFESLLYIYCLPLFASLRAPNL